MMYSLSVPIPPQLIAEPSTPSHWQRYLELLDQRGVPSNARRYYCRFVEQLIAQTQGKGLLQLEPLEVDSFFQYVANNGGLQHWPFKQCVEAIQLLLVHLANAPWLIGRIGWFSRPLAHLQPHLPPIHS